MPTRAGATRPAGVRGRTLRAGLLLGSIVVVLGLVGAGIERRLAGAEAPNADGEPGPEVAPGHFEQQFDVSSFQRGSLHSHSAMSDGDLPAAAVIAWYRDHDYRFLALTDHNRYFDPLRYRSEERPDFVLLPGEEVSLAAEGLPVHVNAICTRHGVGGGNFADRQSALRWAVAQIGSQGGVSVINHPNFLWALDAEMVGGAPAATLLEIFSGHPAARWAGDVRHPAAEEMWHSLLTAGSTLAPAAVDDAHSYGREPLVRGAIKAYPGTGWVVTYAADASRDAICEALRRGELYASNGPELTRLRVDADQISVWLADHDAMVEFLGATRSDGRASFLEPDEAGGNGWVATYRLTGAEQFVRLRITTAGGHQAWTRAFRVVR